MKAEDIFKRLLKARDIEDIVSFAVPKYDELADPYLLPDMDKAVKRLEWAIKNDELVAIYGDYDVDGLTATALLAEVFEKCGLRIETYIPDRFVDGYGLGQTGIDELKLRGASLIITVDTGSLANDQIDYANKNKIDVIVTDHHNVGQNLPKAVAVLNPKRKDSKYPFDELAGVGVAFTLARAMQKQREELAEGHEKWLLDYVALGTVCDIVSLTGENRTLVYWGLQVMQKSRRPGLIALAHVSGADLESVDTTTLGYRFGPRLNASGRLEHADMSLQLLREKTGVVALDIANELNQLNYQRREDQEKIFLGADKKAEKSKDSVLVLSDKNWSHGIIGIVASHLVEKYQKPTFLLQIDGDEAKGSARSFGDFHLSSAIEANRKLLIKGGGHFYAAGITLKKSNIDIFRVAINKYYDELKIDNQSKHLNAAPDITLDSFDGLDENLIKLTDQLAPFGIDNQSPMYQINNVTIADWRPVGQDGKHAKIIFEDINGVKRDGIGFSMVEKMPEIGEIVNTIISLELNEFNGRTNLQHRLVEIK